MTVSGLNRDGMTTRGPCGSHCAMFWYFARYIRIAYDFSHFRAPLRAERSACVRRIVKTPGARGANSGDAAQIA